MSEDDKSVCKTVLDHFIEKTLSDKNKRYLGNRGGGYTSGLWRGRYGIDINMLTKHKPTKPITLRRISKNNRKFACVYEDTLHVQNDKFLYKEHEGYRDLLTNGSKIPSMCQCPKHKASIKVDWKNNIPEFDLYYEYGIFGCFFFI